jgi:hypothetical protein
MAIAQRALQPVWHMQLVENLNASDERAEKLVDGLGVEQLNWQPARGCWSVGQCLEHLCITNEAYLPAISAALREKPDEPVEQIIPGWFGRWFIRNFIEPHHRASGRLRPRRSALRRLSACLSWTGFCPTTRCAALSLQTHEIRT